MHPNLTVVGDRVRDGRTDENFKRTTVPYTDYTTVQHNTVYATLRTPRPLTNL